MFFVSLATWDMDSEKTASWPFVRDSFNTGSELHTRDEYKGYCTTIAWQL